MDAERPPAGVVLNYFVLFELTSEDPISRKIIWTIHHDEVAPVALVFGWKPLISRAATTLAPRPSNY